MEVLYAITFRMACYIPYINCPNFDILCALISMYACEFVCICLCLRVIFCVIFCVYLYMYVYVHPCLSLFIYLSMPVCVYACMNTESETERERENEAGRDDRKKRGCWTEGVGVGGKESGMRSSEEWEINICIYRLID